MPRKSSRKDTSASKEKDSSATKEKDTSATKEKESDEVKVVEQESAPRRSGRAATKSDSGEPERSRRSSTAAQTAVSVADSRVTRSRNSPSDSRRGADSPPARARSARRSISHVNYKESDGEEEGSTPKNEENFDSHEEFDDSDSDEKAKRAKKLQKTPPKGRSSKQKAKAPKVGRRGRPHKKKSETIDISDDSGNDHSDSTYGEKKGKSSKGEEDTKSSRKRPRKSSTTDSGDKPGRRSARGSVGSRATPEPLNKRPSRNKQVKKYTEVDEDFSDAKSEEEVVETKREPSRKRKREKVDEASTVKKPKKGSAHEKDDIKDEESLEETSEPEEKPSTKTSEKKRSSKQEDSEEAEDSEEPMEIDEEDADSPSEKKRSKKTSKTDDDQDKSVSSKKSKPEKKAADDADFDDSENSKDGEQSDDGEDKPDRLVEKKKGDSPIQKDETEDTQHSKTSSQYSDEGEESADENEDAVPKTAKKQSSEQSKSDEVMDLKTNSNCLDSKPENTFPPKDTIVETSVNGEDDKLESATVPPVTTSPQGRNDLPPKQNGSHENDSFQRTDNYLAVRRYVVNPSLTEDLRSSLKEKTFGVASYGLRGSESINKDKLVQELSKLKASVVCLQDVPKALYHDVLESNMDVLGFKGIGSWPKGVQHPGLATFYKTSVFRLSKTTEASLQKLIEKDIEILNMEEAKQENLFRYLNRCGNVLFLYLSTIFGDRHLIVGNAELPSTSVSLHTMQISCLSQEIVSISDEMRKPLLLCGELNMVENKIPYQLLRHGSLTDGMAEELKAKVDESFLEVATFESFLKKASVRPSCKMSSCYATVLGKELPMPSTEVTSSNLVWFTPDSLRTIGVLDVSGEASNHVVSLKADVAFSV